MYKCYDYKCSQCDKIFEELTETNKSEPVRCPHCDSLDVTRQFPKSQKVEVK
jgi:putative FmdB family regulatory protein